MPPEQEQLAVSDDDVAFLQLSGTGTQTFYLPSFQNKAGLELLFDEIIVPRFFVAGDTVFVIVTLSHDLCRRFQCKIGSLRSEWTEPV